MNAQAIVDKIARAVKEICPVYVGIDRQNPPSSFPQIVIYSVKTEFIPSVVRYIVEIGLAVNVSTITEDDGIFWMDGFVSLNNLIELVKTKVLQEKGFIRPSFVDEKITDLDEFPNFGATLTFVCEDIIPSRNGVYYGH